MLASANDVKMFDLGQQQLLQLVLNTIPSYVFWKDLTSNYLGCNQKFAQRADLATPQEIVGKSDFDLPWSQGDAEYYRKIDREVMESRVPQVNFEESQTIDGVTKWLSTSKIPLFDANGEVMGILGTFEDITARKEAELKLQASNANLLKANARLEAMNSDLEQFAYATSHDLQEPLRMIGGFTGLIERRYAKSFDPQGLEYLNFVKEGAQRMSTLVHEILAYARAEHQEDGLVAVNLDELLEEVITPLSESLMDRGVQIDVAWAVPVVICRPQRMKMLFHNLIANGIKFNRSTSPTLKIRNEAREGAWYFSFEDNGIGIDNAYQEAVFKPFKRLHTRDKFKGNGIGLSLCKRIIQLHEGQIWFTSQENVGTTFHFTIDRTEEASH